jgi:hypothetical protein
VIFNNVAVEHNSIVPPSFPGLVNQVQLINYSRCFLCMHTYRILKAIEVSSRGQWGKRKNNGGNEQKWV